MTAGWGMINVFNNKLLLSPTVSGQICTSPQETWLSLVKQELANVVTALVYFILSKIVSYTASDEYLRSPRTVPHPHKLICHHWNKERTPNCSFPNCHYEHICSLYTFILRLSMFITKQFIALTVSTKAEAGHLLQGSHNLHHYSPKATSPNHHF